MTCRWAFTAAASIAAALAAPLAAAQPLTWEGLSHLVCGGAQDEQVLAAVRREGLAFELTFEHVRAIRDAGRSHAFLHALVKAALERRRVDEGGAAPATSLPPDTGTEAPRFIPDPLPPGTAALDRRACLPMDWRPPRGASPATAVALAASELSAAAATGAAGMTSVATSHRIAAWSVLRAAGMENAACAVAREVLLHWATPLEYACAILAMEETREAVDCPLSDPALPARVDLSTLPSNAIAPHLYLVGSDLIASDRGAVLGREMLRAVPVASRHHPAARRMVAQDLLAHRQFRSATRALLHAIESARRHGDAAVRDLCLLDLGRIAFENDLYDTAVYYYLKVDPRSPVWPQAAYERGWSSLMAGHPGRALGAALTLRRLGLATFDAWPDLGLLRAAAYMNACMYPEARAAAEDALRSLKGLEAAVARFAQALDPTPTPAVRSPPAPPPLQGDSGDAAPAAAALLPPAPPPPVEIDARAVLEALPSLEREAGRLVATSRTASVEAALLRDLAAGRPGTEGLLRLVADREREARLATSAVLVASLRRLRDAIFWTRARLIELEVDIDSEQRERLSRQVMDLDDDRARSDREVLLADLPMLARKGLSSAEIVGFAEVRTPDAVLFESDIEDLRFSGLPSDAIEEIRARFVRKPGRPPVGVDPAGVDTRVLWDFSGEFWSDEMNGLRVDLQDLCGQ